jgi:hypothetical protein
LLDAIIYEVCTVYVLDVIVPRYLSAAIRAGQEIMESVIGSWIVSPGNNINIPLIRNHVEDNDEDEEENDSREKEMSDFNLNMNNTLFINSKAIRNNLIAKEKLKQLKGSMTKQAEPSLIVRPDGKPAVVIPEQGQKLTIDELQKNLESWGKAARTGEYSMPGGTDNIFKGIAPGTIKYVSRQVLNGFKGDLDAAVSSNIKGATELRKARDQFRDGLKELDAYAETPFVKAFMKDNPSALDAT